MAALIIAESGGSSIPTTQGLWIERMRRYRQPPACCLSPPLMRPMHATPASCEGREDINCAIKLTRLMCGFMPTPNLSCAPMRLCRFWKHHVKYYATNSSIRASSKPPAAKLEALRCRPAIALYRHTPATGTSLRLPPPRTIGRSSLQKCLPNASSAARCHHPRRWRLVAFSHRPLYDA
jgi:hypothetical protein